MSNEIVIPIPDSTLDGLAIERLYSEIKQARTAFKDVSLVLDCVAISFTRPAGVMGLITAAQTWQRWSGEPIQLRGLRPKVRAYLERLDLFTHCSSILKPEGMLPESDRFSRSLESGTMLEVTPIASDETNNTEDVQRAILRTQKILAQHYGPQHQHITELLTLISELAQNIIHSKDTGYIMVQRYSIGQESQVVIAITDAGIGIEQSLRTSGLKDVFRATTLTKGSDYIRYALEEGVTSKTTSRGLGLYHVSNTVKSWNGTLIIRSAGSRIEIRPEGTNSEDNLSSIPGTQVTITANGVFVNPVAF